MKTAHLSRLAAVFAVLLSCDMNSPSDRQPEQSSTVLTAQPLGSASAPEYRFEDGEFADAGFYASSLLTPPQPYPSPQADTYEYFFNFRLEKFASKTEPLINERFGGSLGIKKAGLWDHASYNSHAVGFATSLPAISVIEYGETEAYGGNTGVSESYFYNHLHYLKNLKEGTTYHYRVIVKDENGDVLALPDRTFATKTFTPEIKKLFQGDFVHEDGGRSGLWITAPGLYVLMEDIATDGLGINIKSSDVAIDLNGHTLVYDNGDNPYNETSDGQYNESGSWGIRAGRWNFVNAKIYNGVIKQGKTGSEGRGPLFLFHMGATKNEIAGLTLDYYGDSVSGMYTGRGYVHHNVLYDRGNKIADRHMGVRALVAEPGDSSEVAYNSLRRFRHNGISGATLVRDNELYSDSFATNSFALGAGDHVAVKNNKIFGMGYHPIGVGWGSNIHVKDNFIYMWGFAPTRRDPEYPRDSSVAGMRVTNYGGTNFENMLFEGNVIVLKAANNCTMARGIWTSNGVNDRNILYRHNTVKVEALPDNYRPNTVYQDYYNDDVNNAIAAISVQGNGWDSEEIPDALIFEDNRLISNINHIIIGEGYGISSGVRFYRTTFEKIIHDNPGGNEKFFAPIRLGFWYWNTLKNRMVDMMLHPSISEEEMKPHFYGGAGKMDMFYGKSITFQFHDGDGLLIAHKNITLVTEDSGVAQTRQTDAGGRASFDILSIRHFKYGNSLEDGGKAGEPGQSEHGQHIFSAEGYDPYRYAP